VRNGERRGEARLDVSAEVLERARLAGREPSDLRGPRHDGLRKGELESLTVGQAHLDGPPAA
jgi:hypothetical protein